MSNRQRITRTTKHIPPPPGPEEGYEAIIAYFDKYSSEELEKAGYLEEVEPEYAEEVTASGEYHFLCRNGLHIKLSRKDYELLARLAARKHVAAENLAKGWVLHSLRQEAKQLSARRKRSSKTVQQPR
jgi:hypothetical protein